MKRAVDVPRIAKHSQRLHKFIMNGRSSSNPKQARQIEHPNTPSQGSTITTAHSPFFHKNKALQRLALYLTHVKRARVN